MGQIASLLSNRPRGLLPSNTEKNPKEQANAITASRKQLEQTQRDTTKTEDPKGVEEEDTDNQRKMDDSKNQETVDQQFRTTNQPPYSRFRSWACKENSSEALCSTTSIPPEAEEK